MKADPGSARLGAAFALLHLLAPAVVTACVAEVEARYRVLPAQLAYLPEAALELRLHRDGCASADFPTHERVAGRRHGNPPATVIERIRDELGPLEQLAAMPNFVAADDAEPASSRRLLSDRDLLRLEWAGAGKASPRVVRQWSRQAATRPDAAKQADATLWRLQQAFEALADWLRQHGKR